MSASGDGCTHSFERLPIRLCHYLNDISRLSALFHPYLCGRKAAEWLINMSEHRVAIYIRVGNKDQLIASAAVQQQKQELEKFAEENNMIVVGHYYDIGFSGRDLNRPGLKNIMADGERKMFKSVLVPKHDNLYRGSWLNAPKWPFNVIAKNQRSRTRER